MGKVLAKIIISAWDECCKRIKQFFNRDDNDPYGNNPYVIM
ncbi:MAG: hypothetical protein ACTHKA_19935 [Anaerocolumna jejuensis]